MSDKADTRQRYLYVVGAPGVVLENLKKVVSYVGTLQCLKCDYNTTDIRVEAVADGFLVYCNECGEFLGNMSKSGDHIVTCSGQKDKWQGGKMSNLTMHCVNCDKVTGTMLTGEEGVGLGVVLCCGECGKLRRERMEITAVNTLLNGMDDLTHAVNQLRMSVDISVTCISGMRSSKRRIDSKLQQASEISLPCPNCGKYVHMAAVEVHKGITTYKCMQCNEYVTRRI